MKLFYLSMSWSSVWSSTMCEARSDTETPHREQVCIVGSITGSSWTFWIRNTDHKQGHFSNVSDLYSFNTDPDTTFQAEYRSGSGSRVLRTKNWIKFTHKKVKFFLGSNTTILNFPIPRPPERTYKLQKKTSALKREHPALQNMKFYNFFLLLWVIFALLDPDPLTWLNPDPDPKHCYFPYWIRISSCDRGSGFGRQKMSHKKKT